MVELSPLQRLMLANQYRILEKVDPDYAQFYRLSEKIAILEGGFESEYAAVMGTFMGDTLPAEECRLVVDVLTMNSWLQDHADSSNPKLKEALKRAAFVEFDANNENEHLSYAQFLFNRPDARYPGIKNVVNSHHSTLSHHREMVKRWKELGPGAVSEEDACRILGIEVSSDTE